MQTTPKPRFSNEPSFFNKQTTDILGVSIGALAIVIFLSIAFVRYDATNLPSSNSTIGVNHHGVNNHGVNHHGEIDNDESNQREIDQPAPSEDLIAAAVSTLPRKPFQFVSSTSASLSRFTLNATLSPDNTMWRLTKDGWHDISMMAVPPPANKPLLEGVHPITWSAMLLMASMLLLIMASSDEEVKKLLGRSIEPKKEF